MVAKLAIFTVEEALTKWCPFARQMLTLDQGANPIAVGAANRFNDSKMSLCVSTGCMAWRWYQTNVRRAPGNDLVPDGETYGYCGLSGSPAPVRDL